MEYGTRSLAEFIKGAHQKYESLGFPSNEYVKEPGFKALYVRYGRRLAHGEVHAPVLDIANVEVLKEGRGTFTSLVHRLRRDYPELGLFVENVLSPRFAAGLEHMGFKKVMVGESMCFFMPGNSAGVPLQSAMGRRT